RRPSSRRFRGCLLGSSIDFAPFKELVQFLTQLEPGPEQPRFHGRHGYSQQLSCFFGGEFLDVAQQEDNTKTGVELVDDLRQDLVQLSLRVALLGRGSPVFNFTRYQVVIGLDRLIESY